ncbi:MAG: hypothetical protein R3C16_02885 [Hyphomonadaceae bacterium]
MQRARRGANPGVQYAEQARLAALEADIIKSNLLEDSGLTSAEADAAARKWEQIEGMFERQDFARLLYMMPFLSRWASRS